MINRSMSRSNLNLEVLVFVEGGIPENLVKKPKAGRELTS